MTHRHKNQTDEYAAYEAAVHKALDKERPVSHACAVLSSAHQPYATARPADANHGSRTDSNTRGGKA